MKFPNIFQLKKTRIEADGINEDGETSLSYQMAYENLCNMMLERTKQIREEVSNPQKAYTLTQNALNSYFGATNHLGAQKNIVVNEDGTYSVPSVSNQQFGGLTNPVAGMGGQNDPFSYSYRNDVPYLSYQILDVYYRTNWIASRIIDTPANDMTRKWRRFVHEDEEAIKKRKDAERNYNVASVVNEAVKWADLYGGAGVVFSLKGEIEADFSKPLDVNSIKKGDLEFMSVVIKDQANPTSNLCLDPFNITYLKPEQYYIATTSGASTVHSSRIVIFYGKKLPIYSALKQIMWGDSKLAQLLGLIDITEALWQNSGGLVSKANVDVIKMKSYLQTLSKAPEQIWKRLGFNKKMLSNFNTLVLDAEDDFTRNQLSNLTGLSELLLANIQMLAGSCGMPLTKFLGTSVGGFSSGDNEILQWANTVHERQNNLRPQLSKIDEIIEMSVFGKIMGLQYEFNSLLEMSELQNAEVERSRAETDEIYVSRGIVSERDVASRLQANETYPTIDQAHLDNLSDEVGAPEFGDLEAQFGSDPIVGGKPTDAV